MQRAWIWWVAKALEGVGLVIVLVGLVLSVQLGMADQGLESMKYEGTALAAGGGMFVVGWLLERASGGRS